MINFHISGKAIVRLICLSFFSSYTISLFAEVTTNKKQPPSAIEIRQAAEYSDSGADNCLRCHDETSDIPATTIFNSSHAVKADKRTPFGQLECESCHGPSGNHSVRRVKKGTQREPMIYFDRGSDIPVAERNEICSSCHQKNDKSHWRGSAHQINDLACTDCHQIHAEEQTIHEVKSAEIEICGKCHQSQKLSSNRFSTHPLQYGQQMGCSDCHSAHGSDNDHMLVAASTNDTCFQCHAEKRGPFLWEHEPSSEDCSSCHSAHGSNNKAMLTQRAPLLCQNCHSSQGHPSLVETSSGFTSNMLLGNSCTNCHSKVHGSNHPSGNLLQR